MSVGIIGAGQLGRMLALAAYPLGQRCLFLDRSADTPGGQIAPSLVGEFTDPALLGDLLRQSEVVTFDWENISVAALRAALRMHQTRVAPPLKALEIAQDRLAEKRCFERLGIPTTRYRAVASRAALVRATEEIGLPGVLKTRRMGYDGKGQFTLRSSADIEAAWQALGGVPLLYEERIDFDFEVSALGVRSWSGDTATYPLSVNLHNAGILRLTLAPGPQGALARKARGYLLNLLRDFRYVGVLAIEFFVRKGRLIANEMAPRVHNSGHWTIEGAATSQFENHVRAILDLPLGSAAARGHSAMINLIGSVPPAAQLLDLPGVHLHDYGKEARPGRKVGHCTIVAESAAARDRLVRSFLRRVYPGLQSFP
ncbi:MAG: 5-(carboxyamino)imidazole ribonucleotide synthase [Steroidobacteraceae bacterium]